MLYVINARAVQLIGLFIAGLLIGRSGVYKDPDKMVKWSKKIFPFTIVWILLCYIIVLMLPSFNFKKAVISVGTNLFKTYAGYGMIMMYICGIVILYYKYNIGRRVLDKLAPVGRMSVTNYIMQSIIGVFIFYNFGLGLAHQSFLTCFIIAILIGLFQVLYSNWWIKRFYYGPMEWLWRTLLWFKKAPMKRGKKI